MVSDEVHSRLSDIMDRSNFPESSKWFDNSRQAEPGLWKNETPNGDLVSFAATKGKCYSLLVSSKDGGGGGDGEEKTLNTCKSLPSSAKAKLRHEEYKTAIRRDVRFRQPATATRICMRDYQLKTVRHTRVALSPCYYKRYLLSCGRHSRPFGHPLNATSDACDRCVFISFSGKSIVLE